MTLKLNGSSSGSVSIDAPASTTSGADITFKLPVADGSSGQVIKTDASGNLGWIKPGLVIKKTYYEIPRAAYTQVLFPDDDTAPQIDEGTEVFSQAYTPSTGSCDLYITAHFNLSESSNVANAISAGLWISDNTDALQVKSSYTEGTNPTHNCEMYISYKMASWGTSSKTFSIRTGGGNAINYAFYNTGYSSTRYSADACKTSFIIEEIAT